MLDFWAIQSLLEDNISDETIPEKVENWAEEKVAAYRDANLSLVEEGRFGFLTVADTRGLGGQRRFINALLLADWLSYGRSADRVSYVRLQGVVRDFRSGFRLYVCRPSEGELVPVGYSGWYPIEESVFEKMEQAPSSLTNRGQIRPSLLFNPQDEQGAYVYLFNFSVAPSLKGGWLARRLLEDLKNELTAFPKRGLASVTVSEDGQRVSRRFGLEKTGAMTHEGDVEDVFVRRFDGPVRGFTLRPRQRPKPV